MELLRDTLDVVETVDTDNELDALELAFEGGDALQDFGLLETLLELLRIDPNGERTDGDDTVLEFDAVGGGGKSTGTRSAERAGELHRSTYRIREQLLRKWRAYS